MSYRFERAYSNFHIIDPTTPSGRSKLFDIVLPASVHLASPAPHSLLQAVLASGSCKSVIVEKQYVDREHIRAYTHFYARAFPDYGKYSVRLHFFSVKLVRSDLRDLERIRIRDAYLGYAVVRPLRVRKIGRTVIRPSVGNPRAEFHLADARFRANIAGSELPVEGVPFLEQDSRAAACASAAIWMSTQAASQRFELTSATSTEITELATGFNVGDAIYGSSGLRVNEMEHALRQIGYNPLHLATPDREAAMQALHPYLEGGLAPILLIRLVTDDAYHAIVAVGHTYDVNAQPGRKAQVAWRGGPIEFWRSSDWIDALIAHDDQRGLYRRVRFLAAPEAERLGGTDKQSCLVEIDMTLDQFSGNAGWPSSEVAEIYAVLVPVPPGISMNGIEAEERAARLWQILFG